VLLRDPYGRHVNVSLQVVPERRIGKNRLHLGLYTEDQGEEVARLLALGATRHARTPEPGEDFIVLEDPEGNLFCVGGHPSRVNTWSGGSAELARVSRP
jgi:hypothetical protein